MRLSWISQVHPKPNDKCPWKRHTGRRKAMWWWKGRDGVVQVQANTDSLITLTSLPWCPPELPAGSPQCIKSLLLLLSVELNSISLPYCSSPEKESSLTIGLCSAPFLLTVHVNQSFSSTCRGMKGAVHESGPRWDLDALTLRAAGWSHWSQGPRLLTSGYKEPLPFISPSVSLCALTRKRRWSLIQVMERTEFLI